MAHMRRSANPSDKPSITKTTAREHIQKIIQEFIMALEDVPGWREWQQQKIDYTLTFDTPNSASASKTKPNEFGFPEDIKKQHDVIMSYLVLVDGITSLKECEYYFRRYPFHGLPLSRDRHVVNICEMYVSRFYEIRERVKRVLNAVNIVIFPKKLNVGKLIKRFDATFDQEITARHAIHHREPFSNIETDGIFLIGPLISHCTREVYLRRYRQVVNKWVQRVRQQGKLMDTFLEVVAEAIIENCKFTFPKNV